MWPDLTLFIQQLISINQILLCKLNVITSLLQYLSGYNIFSAFMTKNGTNKTHCFWCHQYMHAFYKVVHIQNMEANKAIILAKTILKIECLKCIQYSLLNNFEKKFNQPPSYLLYFLGFLVNLLELLLLILKKINAHSMS